MTILLFCYIYTDNIKLLSWLKQHHFIQLNHPYTTTTQVVQRVITLSEKTSGLGQVVNLNAITVNDSLNQSFQQQGQFDSLRLPLIL